MTVKLNNIKRNIMKTIFKPKICISIAEESTEKALASARKMEKQADVLEIRLDSLPCPETTPFLEGLSTPLLFTNRPRWEGGHFSGEEKERIRPLLEAINKNTSFIDIELNTDSFYKEKVLSKARGKRTKSIISWHNFQYTPPLEELYSILGRQMTSGADIGKIVTMARDPVDVLQVLYLQTKAHEKNFFLIAFCMGEAGRISRLATLELGGFMTYAAPGSLKNTAPGQLTVNEINRGLEIIRNENRR